MLLLLLLCRELLSTLDDSLSRAVHRPSGDDGAGVDGEQRPSRFVYQQAVIVVESRAVVAMNGQTAVVGGSSVLAQQLLLLLLSGQVLRRAVAAAAAAQQTRGLQRRNRRKLVVVDRLLTTLTTAGDSGKLVEALVVTRVGRSDPIDIDIVVAIVVVVGHQRTVRR